MSTAFWFMVAVTGTAFFTFITFVIWFDGRRKDREAHYRNEMARQIAEAGDASPILEFVRANERAAAERVQLGLSVAGLITMAVGAALMIFLYALVPAAAVYLVGLFPLFVGIVMLFFAKVMMKPKE